MDPNIWGPHAWFFLHTIARNYPENPSSQDKQSHLQFFSLLQSIIPCEICKQNYKAHFVKFPLQKSLNTRVDFQKWLINIHNEVNKIHKKKQYTYEEVTKLYDDIYDKKINYMETIHSKKLKKIITILMICLGIIVIQNFYFIFKKLNTIIYQINKYAGKK